MSEERACAVVAYDIASNRRRRRVRKVLSEWRVAGQKSVHVCWISRRKAESLFIEICDEIDPDEDRLLMAFSQGVVFQTAATDAISTLVFE